MTDYAAFKQGSTQYPVPLSGSGIGGSGASFLRDVDAPLFYILEFYRSVITTHLATRFLAEASAAGVTTVTAAVADVLPLNPEPYLTEEHLRFPLLAAYRKASKIDNIGLRTVSTDTFEISYVLPPLQSGEAEVLLPMLRGVAAVVLNRTDLGADAAYTPTTPTGTSGESVWATDRAGIAVAKITDISFGSYAPSKDLFFPAVVLSLELKERSDYASETFDTFNGGDVNIDIKDPVQDTVVTNFVQFSTGPAPTLTVASPNNGTKTGGTTVTLTGANFVVGTTPVVEFGGVAATNVVVLTTTSLQCKSPAHDAFTTFIADVVVTNPDGQSATLVAGYSFTTP